MSKKKDIKIASNLSIKDWKKLDESNSKYWKLASDFFKERIKTRYLTPINAIKNLNLNEGEGFAIVNLQCSLIETFECFINGWLFYFESGKLMWKDKNEEVVKYKNKDVKSRSIFISFFDEFKDNFNDLKGEYFYSKVRCGLLHETQTKDNWVIRVAEKDTENCYEAKEDKKIIYRNNFQKKLEKLLEDYQQALIDGKDFRKIKSEDLRKNFITKVNHICNQSEL
jgi:hypothetical protein